MPTYTFYAPGPGDRMEGGFETSKKNREGENIPRTLDDYRLGKSPYVTVASDPSRYGQDVNLGKITYRSPLDNNTYTLDDVKGYIHDTGSAFQGRPDKLDIATGDFRGWNPSQASSFVARNSVGGGDLGYAPEPRKPMFPDLLSSLAPQAQNGAAPSFGQRLGAGLQGFAQSGGLLSALGNLIGGVATGERTDEDYLTRKERAAERARQQYNTDRTFGELQSEHGRQQRNFEMQYNKPQVVFKSQIDEDTGERTEVPYIVTPGGPGKPPNVQQLDPSAFKPSPSVAPSVVPGATSSMTPSDTEEAIPATAQLVQGVVPGPAMPPPPPGLKGPALRAFNKKAAEELGKSAATSSERQDRAQPLLDTIGDIKNLVDTPEFKKLTETSPLLTESATSAPYNPMRMGYELAVREPQKIMQSKIQQMSEALNLEFGRLYYQGQGAVSEFERKAVERLTGQIGSARSPQQAKDYLNQLSKIVQRNLGKVPNFDRSQPSPEEKPAPSAAPSGAPKDAIRQELIRRGLLKEGPADANSL